MPRNMEARGKLGNQAKTALDNIGKFQATAGQSAYQERRRLRYGMRFEMQRREIRAVRAAAGLDPNGRAKYGDPDWLKMPVRATCGQPRYGGGAVSVKLAERDGSKRAHYSGLVHCGSVRFCPVCSGIIRAERAEEIREGARRHLDAGGGLIVATFTTRHFASDSLAYCFGIHRDAMARMQSSRRYKEWRRSWGIVGSVKANEETWGRHGWHPHCHSLLFSEMRVSSDDARVMRSELFDMWADSVGAVGGRTLSFDAFDLQAVESGHETLAGYIAKVEGFGNIEGLGSELSLADVKSGRAEGSISPFEFLRMKGPAAEALWREYVESMSGKSTIRWSRGLRAMLGMTKERTDEEIVTEAERRGEPVFLIERGLYRETVHRSPERLCALLEAVERGALAEASAMLGAPSYEILLDGRFVALFTRFDPGLSELVAVA